MSESIKTALIKTALSATLAKTLIMQSPEHAWQQRREELEATPDMDFGTICHELLLGKGDGMVILDFDDFRTNAAKDARDKANAEDKTPILRAALERAELAIVSWRKKLIALGFDTLFGPKGEAEKFLEWTEPNGVVCRCCLDWTLDNWIWDLKTSKSAHPSKIQRAINDGHYIQRAFYIRGMEQKYPELIGRFNFGFVFAETKPPFSVTVVNRVDGKLDLMGRKAVQRAIETWGVCLASGQWPGYETKPIEAESLPWAFKDSLEEEEDDE